MGERGPESKIKGVSCPFENCTAYGNAEFGNVVGYGTYETNDGTVKKYKCKSCGRTFGDRTGTAYYKCRTQKKEFDDTISAINNGMGVRATARQCGCTTKTVMSRVRRAGISVKHFTDSRETDMCPSVVQFDEMHAILKKNQPK